MSHGLPKGVRDEELETFTTEHPSGVRAQFERVDENLWAVIEVLQPSDVGNSLLRRSVDALVHDVEHHGDALVTETSL